MEVELLNPANRCRRRVLLQTLCLSLSLLATHAFSQAATGVDEYRAKAAFLYNVCKFVTWPESTRVRAGRPFVVGVVDNRPLMAVLSRELAGKSMGGRKIVVIAQEQLRDADAQVVYCTDEQLRGLTRSSRSRLARAGVMTVGDGSECLAVGGILALGIRDGRLAFEVNIGAARRAGLEMNANLLGFAAKVVDE